jgi:hypothetical protein
MLRVAAIGLAVFVGLVSLHDRQRAGAQDQGTTRSPSVEVRPPKNADGALVEIAPRVWCLNSMKEPLLAGTPRFCRNMIAATLRVETPGKPHIKRFTLRTNYLEPHPVTDLGKEVDRSDAEARVDCSTREIWMLSSKAFDVSGALINTDVPPAPLAMPTDIAAAHAKIVCRQG